MAEKHVSLETVIRRLGRQVKRIEELYRELEALQSMIPAPTPEEFQEMAEGTRPLTLETLLIGVLDQAMFHLGEARNVVDRYRPYTLGSLGKGMQIFWHKNLGDHIEREVERRARSPVVFREDAGTGSPLPANPV